MLSNSSVDFLRRLLAAVGPSGFEDAAARVWRTEAETFARVEVDVVGNSFAWAGEQGVLPDPDQPTILLAGHIDEIGLIVTYIDEQGFAWVAPIGGWDPQVLVGQRMRFLGRDGDVTGVIGKKPIHLMKPDEREKASKLTDLWVDIGATSREDAERRLRVGDPGVVEQPVLEFPNGRLVSRAIDNRIGAYVVLEALRRYHQDPGEARVVAIASSREEIGLTGGGILPGAAATRAIMGLVVDVTFATDHPQVEKKEQGDHALGSGPVLTRGAVISPVVFDLLRTTAEAGSIPHTVQAAGKLTSTDADYVMVARTGIATGLVSVPNRYMHSPNEMVSLQDLDHAAELLARACRAVTKQTRFNPR
ncbi:MAG: M20/M25/M40 family metallo-hydrolase [Gemmatimonadaceae bacterium]|jgi:endoglucanase|nr:M20/M25/M40 family metallo-hydrolase [Gemmatimonadaceae bacterium]